MNFHKWHYALALFLIVLSPTLSFAEKRYVSDTLIVSLRATPSNLGEVLSYLKSGDSLNIIEENEEGFVLIETANGKQGWIPKKYTIDTIPKDLIIAGLEKKISNLNDKVASASKKAKAQNRSLQNIKTELDNKQKDVSQLQATISELKLSVKSAETKYDDLKQKTKGVVEIYSERDNLLARLQTREKEVAMLKIENADLVQTERLLWFLAGFGVFLVGWIMGKFSRKTRRGLTM